MDVAVAEQQLLERESRGDTGVALEAAGLSKRFGGTAALKGVDLEIRRGEIHALLGGNGSGKSTLIKILAGVTLADTGWIDIGGRRTPASGWTPGIAAASGLRFVHQTLGVFLDLSVAENLSIGRGYETRRGKTIRWSVVNSRAQRLLERFHIAAAPGTLLATLRPADRSLVAIARALQDQEETRGGILVLDEPTASLPAPDVELLLAALRRYAAAGQTILFVSHRLDEVLGLADRASVLRDGVRVTTELTVGLTSDRLIRLMLGQDVQRRPRRRLANGGRVILEARSLAAGPLDDVALSVRSGEVLGVAGLLGSGRTALLRVLFGDLPCRGEVRLDGQPVKFRSPSDAMRAGIGLVPEDREGAAAFPDMSVRENLSAGSVSHYWRKRRLCHSAERQDALDLIHRYGIRPRHDDLPFGVLSGGNQQRAILARWLRRSPRILLLDDPTQGVDAVARAELHELIRGVAEAGGAVVAVCSDFEELAQLCDRAVVLTGGRLKAELRTPEITSERLTELCYRGQIDAE